VALIETVGLTKHYRMGDSIVRALDDINLIIEQREFVAITGASGSGKSTMMHLLGCLDRPTAGVYLLDGRNVAELSDRELAAIRNRSIGFVFQTFNLISRTTALDNVCVPLFYARRSAPRPAARRALERVGLGDRITHKPNEMSGGERQRVAIARAIVNDPILLFADEPTGNLDSRTGEQIMDIFRELNDQGVTVVLVTHEPDVAVQARRIVHMRDGRIISDRTREQYIAEHKAELAAAAAAAAHAGPDLDTAPPTAGAAMADGEPTPSPAEPAPRPLTSSRPVLMAGANGALWFGLMAIFFLLLLVGCGVYVKLTLNPKQMGPGKPPPPQAMIAGLAMLVSLLLAFVSGLIGLFWGRSVRRKIRTVPGNWTGRRRALWGAICGGVAVAISIVLVVVPIVAMLLKARA